MQSLPKAYDPFLLLLQQEKTLFDKWFKAVKKSPDQHLTDIGDATQLIPALLSTLRPDAPTVIDHNVMDPLVQMVNKCAWMLYADRQSTTTAPPQIHQAWNTYLEQGAQCYPDKPHDTPPSHLPFFPLLLQPEGGWLLQDLTGPISKHMGGTYWSKQYDVHTIPIHVTATFTPTTMKTKTELAFERHERRTTPKSTPTNPPNKQQREKQQQPPMEEDVTFMGSRLLNTPADLNPTPFPFDNTPQDSTFQSLLDTRVRKVAASFSPSKLPAGPRSISAKAQHLQSY